MCPQTFIGFAADISKGGPKEADQSLTFSLESVTSASSGSSNAAGLFTAFSLSERGTLSFSIARFRTGVFTVKVRVQDDGGTADGGVDTAIIPFNLTITPVDIIPTFTVCALVLSFCLINYVSLLGSVDACRTAAERNSRLSASFQRP